MAKKEQMTSKASMSSNNIIEDSSHDTYLEEQRPLTQIIHEEESSSLRETIVVETNIDAERQDVSHYDVCVDDDDDNNNDSKEERSCDNDVEYVENGGEIDDNDEVVCPICLENSHSMVAGTCGHSFCASCISRMLIIEHKRQRTLRNGPYRQSTNNNNNGLSKSINDGGLCPLCRAPLPLNEMTYVEEGGYLSDDESFQQELQRQQDSDDSENSEYVALMNGGLTAGNDHTQGRNGRRIVLALVVASVVGITIMMILLQVRLAGNYHSGYYDEADYYFAKGNRSVGCSLPMPPDCENGLHQCPGEKQWFAARSRPSMVTLDSTKARSGQSYPAQIASCSSTSPFPSNDAVETPMTFYSQTYAWATVLGTGDWIRVARRRTGTVPCNGTALDVYLVDDEECHVSHGRYSKKSCEFDPNCLVYNEDLLSVNWLSQPGQIYAIFDERRDNGQIEVSGSTMDLEFELLLDTPTNQLCSNAIVLATDGATSPYKFHTTMEFDSKPSFLKRICGSQVLEPHKNGLWFQTRPSTSTEKNVSESVHSNSSSLTVSICSREWSHNVELLVIEGRDCNDIEHLEPGDNRCVTSMTFTQRPEEQGNRSVDGCRWMTWETRTPNQTYMMYLAGPLTTMDWYGEISVFSQ